MQKATNAATTSPINKPDPAAAAAGVKAAKTPAPIMDPKPIREASKVPRRRANVGGWFTRALSASATALMYVPWEGR
ncbi:hypothetical protein GCM10010212_20370 [Paenarthrobacter nicotinovorans]|nr:hypothetical protein GCM10010212_20370 [Paenarthrobacter nicotinovorans]